ncbi:NAD(P)-dependent oxidoreductase [Nocardiopsis ansamitocini]|uniref:NADH-flavin reductase n=1 Tax=Nocardiopsis ansamitocini TaxID=1670832 RepID=A0A9W6UJM2_9ACTN|nr:NAD(P)H-binding protein [Nocardiopsis ansamitocini]GLU48663.1 NADH-flavin reductase [Nocardiopsis ansamitocini]
MKITVFGATGGTGQHVVRQALDSGWRVTAVVRDPARVLLKHPALETVTADVLTSQRLAEFVAGRDAVISALGPRGRKQVGVASLGTGRVLRALEEGGVKRFLALSAVPVGPVPDGEGLVQRCVVIPSLRAALRATYADLAAMEEEMERSEFQWTVVRPPRLTDGPLTRVYRTTVGGNVVRGSSISRADLAHALLALSRDPASVGRFVGVAY